MGHLWITLYIYAGTWRKIAWITGVEVLYPLFLLCLLTRAWIWCLPIFLRWLEERHTLYLLFNLSAKPCALHEMVPPQSATIYTVAAVAVAEPHSFPPRPFFRSHVTTTYSRH